VRPGLRRLGDVNMTSLKNILEACRINNVEEVFWPSSIAAFGRHLLVWTHHRTPSCNQHPCTASRKSLGSCSVTIISSSTDWIHAALRFPGIISAETPPGGGTDRLCCGHLLMRPSRKVISGASSGKILCSRCCTCRHCITAAFRLMGTSKENIRRHDGYQPGRY